MGYETYKSSSRCRADELEKFRKKYEYKEILVGNTRWEYILSSGNGRNLVLLPSGVHFGEMWFEVINKLEGKYAIVAPSFPVLTGMEDALEGIRAILDRHKISQTAIVGLSTSGWIAQCFTRKYRDMVDSLVLINTSAPDIKLVDSINKAMRKAAADHVTHINKGLEKFYLGPAIEKEESDFLGEFLKELLERTTREQVLGLYHLAYEYMHDYHFMRDDLADWKGSVLIMESDDDNGFDQSAGNELKHIYPGAQLHDFHQAGHAPVFSKTDEFIEVLDHFIK